ncbi:MAG: TolC family protein [Polyangiales bacterium]
MRADLALAFALTLAAAPAAAQVAPAPAVTAEGFTLNAALRAAAQHPRVASARSLLRAAGHDVEAAGLWTNPQLGAVYMRSFGFTTFDPQIGVAQLGVTQQVESAGLPGRRRRAAGYEREAAALELDGARRSVELRVVASFVRLVAAAQRLAVLRAAAAGTERVAALVDARAAAGASPGYERTRAALGLADARAAVGDAEADLVAARGELDVAVGPAAASLRGEARGDRRAAVELPPLAPAHDALPATRADLGAARARSRAAGALVDVARAEPAPGFQVYGGVLVGQGYGEQGQRQVDFMVGVTVPLPVANRGEESSRAAAARAQAARESLDAATLEARQRLDAAWREARRRRDALDGFLSGEAAHDRLLAETEAAYRDGRVPVQALLDAYGAVRDARLRAVELAAAAREAEARCWEAVGAAPDAARTGPRE